MTKMIRFHSQAIFEGLLYHLRPTIGARQPQPCGCFLAFILMVLGIVLLHGTTQAQTNLALNKPATGSSSCRADEGPAKAVNGSVSGGLRDKFCSSAAPRFLQVDLGRNFNINRFVVRHAGAGGESTTLNTRDFNIQVSTNGTSFARVVNVTGNTASVTTRNITTRLARFVRLNITAPTQSGGGAARIYEFEVFGVDGGGADFDMSTTPPSLAVSAGAVARYTIGVTGRNGFSGSVALSASGLPPGATVNFIPASINGSGVATMEIFTSGSSGGTFTVTVTGTSSGLPPRTTTAVLTVNGGAIPDFSLSVSPTSQSVTAGNGTTYATTVTRTNGFSGTVALSVSGLPPGATATFNPANVTGTSSLLSISTAGSTPNGSFNLTITGSSGNLVRSANVAFNVSGGGGDACPTCTHKRLKIVNGCSTQPMWINYHTGFNGGVLNAPNRRRLNPGEFIEYDIPDKGLAGVRFWPSMGCDATGNNCTLGASGGPADFGFTCPAGIGCAPPVDSKFEGTFGCLPGIPAAQCQINPSSPTGAPLPFEDFWNTSMVDGYTLPIRVVVNGFCPLGNPGGPPNGIIDCSTLRFGDCPLSENLSTNGQFPNLSSVNLLLRHPLTGDVVGCYSPVAKLTFVHWQSQPNPPFTGITFAPNSPQAQFYACPTPPISVEQCRSGPVVNTNYVQLIHRKCNSTYAYAYDDVDGLSKCPAATNLSYEVTFFCAQ